MSNKKISDFPELESGDVTNEDVLPIVNAATNKKFSWTSIKTALKNYFDGIYTTKNTEITGATKTKITYDSKGLVTAGADATTADINDSANKRYCTDAEKTVIGNTSGVNTGDQTSVSGNAGTATNLQTPRLIDGVSFDGSTNIVVNNTLKIYNALGGSAKGIHWAGNPPLSANGNSLTNQFVFIQAVWIPQDCTVTGLKWLQMTAGNYTANNYNGVGLYSYSGGTLTLVASSTNDGDIWKATSGSFGSKAFSSPYSASAGLYFMANIWCRSAQTTAPTIMRANPNIPQSAVLTQDFSNSAVLSGQLGSQTSFPSSIAISSFSIAPLNIFWFQPY